MLKRTSGEGTIYSTSCLLWVKYRTDDKVGPQSLIAF